MLSKTYISPQQVHDAVKRYAEPLDVLIEKYAKEDAMITADDLIKKYYELFKGD